MKNFDLRYVSWLSVIATLGCTAEPTESDEIEPSGEAFVLVAKQDAPVTRGGKALSALPIAADPDSTQELVFGATTIQLPTADGVVTYARSATELELLVLGDEARADQLAVAASRDAARALADVLGVEVKAGESGRWLLEGSDVWLRIASLESMPGIAEVFPVLVGADTIVDRGLQDAARATAQPLRCEDPIAGVWTGRSEVSRHTFTLSITAGPKGALRGTIDVRVDDGTPGAKPELTATMSAKGTWKNGRLRFDATALTHIESWHDAYNLDHFTGSIDRTGALTAVNNDGGAAFDRPYQLRRVRCGS